MLRPPRVRRPARPDLRMQGQKERTPGCHVSSESRAHAYTTLRDGALARLGERGWVDPDQETQQRHQQGPEPPGIWQ